MNKFIFCQSLNSSHFSDSNIKRIKQPNEKQQEAITTEITSNEDSTNKEPILKSEIKKDKFTYLSSLLIGNNFINMLLGYNNMKNSKNSHLNRPDLNNSFNDSNPFFKSEKQNDCLLHLTQSHLQKTLMINLDNEETDNLVSYKSEFFSYVYKAIYKIVNLLNKCSEMVNAKICVSLKSIITKIEIKHKALIPHFAYFHLTYDSYILTLSTIKVVESFKSELNEAFILKIVLKLCLIINDLRQNKAMRLLAIRWLLNLRYNNYPNFDFCKYNNIFNYYLQPNSFDNIAIKIEKLKILYLFHSENNLYISCNEKIIMNSVNSMDHYKYFPIFSYFTKSLFKVYFFIIAKFPKEEFVKNLCEKMKENLKIVPRILPNMICLLRKIKEFGESENNNRNSCDDKNNNNNTCVCRNTDTDICDCNLNSNDDYIRKNVFTIDNECVINDKKHEVYHINNSQNDINKKRNSLSIDKAQYNELNLNLTTINNKIKRKSVKHNTNKTSAGVNHYKQHISRNNNELFPHQSKTLSFKEIYIFLLNEFTKFIHNFKSHNKLNLYFALFLEISKEEEIEPYNLIKGLRNLYFSYKENPNWKVEHNILEICMHLIKHHKLSTMKSNKIEKLLKEIYTYSFDYSIRDKAKLYYQLVLNVEKPLLNTFLEFRDVNSINSLSSVIKRNNIIKKNSILKVKSNMINNTNKTNTNGIREPVEIGNKITYNDSYKEIKDIKENGYLTTSLQLSEKNKFFSLLDLNYNVFNLNEDLQMILQLNQSKVEREKALILDNGSAYFDYNFSEKISLLSESFNDTNNLYSNSYYIPIINNETNLFNDLKHTKQTNKINEFLTVNDILKLYLKDDLIEDINDHKDFKNKEKKVFQYNNSVYDEFDNKKKEIKELCVMRSLVINNSVDNKIISESNCDTIAIGLDTKQFLEDYLLLTNSNRFYIKLPINFSFNSINNSNKNDDSLKEISNVNEIFSINICFGKKEHLYIQQPILIPYLEKLVNSNDGIDKANKANQEQKIFPYFYKIDLIIYPSFPIPSLIETQAVFYDNKGNAYTGKLNPIDIKFEDYFLPISFPKNYIITEEKCTNNLSTNCISKIKDSKSNSNNSPSLFSSSYLKDILFNTLWKKFRIKDNTSSMMYVNSVRLIDKLQTNIIRLVNERLGPFLINKDFTKTTFKINSPFFNNTESGESNNTIRRNDNNQITLDFDASTTTYDFSIDQILEKASEKDKSSNKNYLNPYLNKENNASYFLAKVLIFVPTKYHILFKIKISKLSSIIHIRSDCFKIIEYLDEYFDSWES